MSEVSRGVERCRKSRKRSVVRIAGTNRYTIVRDAFFVFVRKHLSEVRVPGTNRCAAGLEEELEVDGRSFLLRVRCARGDSLSDSRTGAFWIKGVRQQG